MTFATIAKRVLHALLGLPLAALGVWLAGSVEVDERERTRTLAAGAGAVVTVDAYEVDPARDGELVFVTGEVASKAPLVDADFGISVVALGLDRVVEMYQWQETTHDEYESYRSPSGERKRRLKRTVHEYNPVWSSTLIDSSGFRDGHNANPRAMPYAARRTFASDATIGVRNVDAAALAKLESWQPLSGKDQSGTLPADFRALGGGVFLRGDPANPRIGDVRVTFRRLPPGPASIAAGQSGRGLRPLTMPTGQRLLVARAGTTTPDVLFDLEQQYGGGEGTGQWWFGLFLLAVGTGIVVAPWSTGWRAIVLRTLVVVCAVAAVLVGAVWIGHRPLYGSALLLAALAIGAAFLGWHARSRAAGAA